jgi:NAD(P)-dependent dehydrogenase (short-subunit alcohol dehydrogenase family)
MRMTKEADPAKSDLLISRGCLTPTHLAGRTAVVSGAGRGIGFEAARALLWLGARVVLAERDRGTGRAAEKRLRAEFERGRVLFVHTDVGDEGSVRRLKRRAERAFGQVDIVINNAAVTPLGAVASVPVSAWDRSYRVNLRGPVLLAGAFLPGMLERRQGVFVCVSSVGGAYMGPYEVLKTAQVDLARTLAAELEDSGVIAFTIGPGIVKTPGFLTALPQVSRLYGKSEAEFIEMSRDHLLSPEAAGAGFAAAVAQAERWAGLEIGSRQALLAAEIAIPDQPGPRTLQLSETEWTEAHSLAGQVRQTLAEQHAGWLKRPLFEKQWILRDFKRFSGATPEDWLAALEKLEQDLAGRRPDSLASLPVSPGRIAAYHRHMQEMLAGYEKDPQKLADHMRILKEWESEAGRLARLLEDSPSG